MHLILPLYSSLPSTYPVAIQRVMFEEVWCSHHTSGKLKEFIQLRTNYAFHTLCGDAAYVYS